MESQLSFSSPWATISITTLIFFILIWKKTIAKNSTRKPKLPPGPWRLPLIGNMHHLIGGLPHHIMRDLAKKHGPVMHLQLGQLSNIIISSPEAAEQVLKTHDLNFAQRPQMSAVRSVSYDYIDISFAPYGDYWRQLRKITSVELLSVKRVKSFRSIREEETSKLVELIRGTNPRGSAINFSKMAASLSYWITSRAACGKVWKGEDVFVKCIEELMMVLGAGITIGDAFPSVKWLQAFSKTKSAVDELHRIMDPIIQSIVSEHRVARNGGNVNEEKDLVDVLLNLQENGDFGFPITDDTIKALIMDTFLAGVDTSAATIEWMMSELMKNPRVVEKVQAEIRHICDAKGRVDEEDLDEMKYLKLVLKETFRLHPVTPLLVPRECRESCTIDGYDIPVNSKIMVNTWAMGRDSKYWKDPEQFEPERFVDSSIDLRGNNFEYLPFGAGRRSCPGMSFGLAATEFPMAKLLFHFDWKLINGIDPQDLDMREEMGVTTKRKSPLYVIPTPYVPPTATTN